MPAMTTTTPRLALCCLLAACAAAPADDVDDAVDGAEADKADSTGAYRHYLLWAEPSDGTRWLARAGGGSLRCPDDVVREACEVTSADFLPTLGLDATPDVVFDELERHAMIARGRLIRTDEGRVYLRASALTRGLTEVTPSGACYRIRSATPGAYALELLDHATVEQPQVLFFDEVDPTPDFWGQSTPDVQAQLDAALELAATRPVYTCGALDRRDTGDLWWANQVFAPAT